MSGVQPTSREVYHEKDLPRLPEFQEQVLSVFFENPCNCGVTGNRALL